MVPRNFWKAEKNAVLLCLFVCKSCFELQPSCQWRWFYSSGFLKKGSIVIIISILHVISFYWNEWKTLSFTCELGPVTALPDSGPTQLHRKNRHHTNLGSNSPQTQWGKTCKSLVKLQWSREAKLECKAAKVGTAVQASLLFGHAMDRIHCGGWWCSMSRHVFLKVYVYTFIYMYLYICI